MADLSDSLQSFVTYVQTHLTGDEKGESADFLDHLFRALGHDNEIAPTPPFMPIDSGWTEFRHFVTSKPFHQTVTQIATLLPFSK